LASTIKILLYQIVSRVNLTLSISFSKEYFQIFILTQENDNNFSSFKSNNKLSKSASGLSSYLKYQVLAYTLIFLDDHPNKFVTDNFASFANKSQRAISIADIAETTIPFCQ